MRHGVQLAVSQHAGTGGVVDKEDWRNINWTPISALTGGTSKFKTGLGMKPWYAKGHVDPAGPGGRPICRRPVAVFNDISHLLSHSMFVCFKPCTISSCVNARTALPKSRLASRDRSCLGMRKSASVGHHPKELAVCAGLLPGKLLDVPVARPVLWTPTARLMTIALGTATALAVAWLACCTCWFLGFFERVPVRREDEPPSVCRHPRKGKAAGSEGEGGAGRCNR